MMLQTLRQIRSAAGAAKRGGLKLGRAGVEATNRLAAQRIAVKPTVVQFPVNDICNSRCTMCNIWQQKRDHELTPDELAGILRDPLFSEVGFVGLNGGEPTLRKDLPQITRVLTEGLPKLKELHIITNAIRHADVTERILAVNEVAKGAGKKLSVSVSLDGVGEDHDRNRGVPGNFDSAVKVIDVLKENNIPVSIGCTLTAENCDGADDLLGWCEDHGIEDFEFRLGVEIRRVYNDGYDLMNPLTPSQWFHITMFFDKLSRDPRVGGAQKRFYKSLVDQIAYGSPRSAGCHWQTQGVTLDTRGDLSYCSVKSPVIGSALTGSAAEVYKKGLAQRRQIIKNDCGNCRHDLLGPPPIREMVKQGIDEITEPWRRRIAQLNSRRETQGTDFTPHTISHPTLPHPARWRSVVITGWYGTETQGDKAILGELVHFIRTYSPDCKITLTTIDRKVSLQTVREMPELAGIELVELDRAAESGVVGQADAVIIGGGPLEDIGETEHVWRLFYEANRQCKARVVFGCGVGPFHNERVKSQASAILRMTTGGFFRDRESHDYAVRLGASPKLGIGCDPALRYLHRWAQDRTRRLERQNKPPEARRSPKLIGLVRANTCEYTAGLPPEVLDDRNRQTIVDMASIFETTAAHYGTTAELLAMHSLWLGGDDRLFNRQIAKAFATPGRVSVERGYLTLNQLLESIANADAAVAMRYHGHLFCMALGVPALSIDYTGADGKVAALIKRIGYGQWSLSWQEIDPDVAIGRIKELIDQRGKWSDYFKAQALMLVEELETTYEKSFGVTVPDRVRVKRPASLAPHVQAAA